MSERESSVSSESEIPSDRQGSGKPGWVWGRQYAGTKPCRKRRGCRRTMYVADRIKRHPRTSLDGFQGVFLPPILPWGIDFILSSFRGRLNGELHLGHGGFARSLGHDARRRIDRREGRQKSERRKLGVSYGPLLMRRGAAYATVTQPWRACALWSTTRGDATDLGGEGVTPRNGNTPSRVGSKKAASCVGVGAQTDGAKEAGSGEFDCRCRSTWQVEVSTSTRHVGCHLALWLT